LLIRNLPGGESRLRLARELSNLSLLLLDGLAFPASRHNGIILEKNEIDSPQSIPQFRFSATDDGGDT
jgi:hypothetical protein